MVVETAMEAVVEAVVESVVEVMMEAVIEVVVDLNKEQVKAMMSIIKLRRRLINSRRK